MNLSDLLASSGPKHRAGGVDEAKVTTDGAGAEGGDSVEEGAAFESLLQEEAGAESENEILLGSVDQLIGKERYFQGPALSSIEAPLSATPGDAARTYVDAGGPEPIGSAIRPPAGNADPSLTTTSERGAPIAEQITPTGVVSAVKKRAVPSGVEKTTLTNQEGSLLAEAEASPDLVSASAARSRGIGIGQSSSSTDAEMERLARPATTPSASVTADNSELAADLRQQASTQPTDVQAPTKPSVSRTQPSLVAGTPSLNIDVAASTQAAQQVSGVETPLTQAAKPSGAPENVSPEFALTSRPTDSGEAPRQRAIQLADTEVAPADHELKSKTPADPKVKLEVVSQAPTQQLATNVAANAPGPTPFMIASVSPAATVTPQLMQSPQSGTPSMDPGTPNSAAVERSAVSQVISAVTSRPVGGIIDVHLDPPELGRIEVVLEIVEQGLRATLVAERQATGEMLRRYGAELLQQFQDAGFDDVDLNFGQPGAGTGERPDRTGSQGPSVVGAFDTTDPAIELGTRSKKSGLSGLDIRL